MTSYSTTRNLVRVSPPAIRTDGATGGLRLRGLGKPVGGGSGSADDPLISVITVVRNGERHLEQAIRSVLEQDYDNVEYIVVDGDSTDGTLDIVKRYDEGIDFWLSEPDGGLYEAMNKGVRLTTGAIIGILNADDVYSAATLPKVAAAFTDQTIDFVYGSVMRVSPTGRRLSETHPIAPRLFHKAWAQCVFPHPSLFVRRSVYDAIGLFDTDFRVAADRDFMARMIRKGYRGVQLEGCVAIMRSGGLSDKLPSFKETRRVARKHGVHPVRVFASHSSSVAKQLVARTLPKPLVAALLQLTGSRHRWITD